MNRNAPLSDSLPSCELRGPLERYVRTAFGKKAVKSSDMKLFRRFTQLIVGMFPV